MTETRPVRQRLAVVAAFSRLRWRLFMNALERTGRRDRVERLSRALDVLVPILAILATVPAALGLAAIGVLAGTRLPATGWPLIVVWMGLLALTISACLLPLLVPSGREVTGLRRLLLLPIGRGELYAFQAASMLAEPWIAIGIPTVLFLPAGVAWSAGAVAGLIALAAGLCFMALLAAVATLATSAVQLVTRDRRRGELVAIGAMLLFIGISLVPAMLDDPSPPRRQGETRRPERTGGPRMPEWTGVLPSELYIRSFRSAAAGDYAIAILPVGLLAAGTIAAHAAGWRVFSRLVETPVSGGGARRAGGGWWRIPGLSPAASAVAIAAIRHVGRSPRGRVMLAAPVLMSGVLAVVLFRGGSLSDAVSTFMDRGPAIAGIGASFALLSLHPFTLNQFAIDGAGLTLQLIAPLRAREIVAGKGAAALLLSMALTVAAVIVAALVAGGGPIWLWFAIVLGVLSAALLLLPVSLVLSAVFPRATDLSSVGKGGNPHPAAGLMGLVATLGSLAIPALILWIGAGLLERPVATLLVLAGWTLAAGAAAHAVLGPAAALLERRRENLCLVSRDR